jgi:hypothetical protein
MCCAAQVTYLLKGLFGRACRSLGGVTEPIEAIRDECGQLRGLLAAKLVQINTNLEGEHAARVVRWTTCGLAGSRQSTCPPCVPPFTSMLAAFSLHAAAAAAAAAAGGFPVVLDNLWFGREEGEAVAAALVPKLQKTKVAVEQLLFEVATLEVRSNNWLLLHI